MILSKLDAQLFKEYLDWCKNELFETNKSLVTDNVMMATQRERLRVVYIVSDSNQQKRYIKRSRVSNKTTKCLHV